MLLHDAVLAAHWHGMSLPMRACVPQANDLLFGSPPFGHKYIRACCVLELVASDDQSTSVPDLLVIKHGLHLDSCTYLHQP